MQQLSGNMAANPMMGQIKNLMQMARAMQSPQAAIQQIPQLRQAFKTLDTMTS